MSEISLISVTSDLSDDDIHDEESPQIGRDRQEDEDETVPRCQQPRIEISVSLEYAQEHPSPSSVSLQHSVGDLSGFIGSIPSLPVLSLHELDGNTHFKTAQAASESSSTGPFTSRRRRSSRDHRNSNKASMKHHDHSEQSTGSSSYVTLSSRFSIRGSSRFAVLLCALTVVALSVHDRMEASSRQFMQTSGSRREEVAFPLGHPDEILMSSLSSKSSSPGEKAKKLPKYYLPKLESDGSLKRNAITAEVAKLRRNPQRGSNFAMARGSKEARPIFVPDQPLPGGGFRKPMERFVFDPEQQQRQFEQQQEYERTKSGRNALSWTSWLASMAFIGMVLDSGWKEYYRCRMIQEEQRRL